MTVGTAADGIMRSVPTNSWTLFAEKLQKEAKVPKNIPFEHVSVCVSVLHPNGLYQRI